MKISERGLKLIKQWESCSLNAYHGGADRPGLYTIGWGSIFDFELGRAIRKTDVWTQEKCNRILAMEIENFEKDVEKEVGKDCPQLCFDALVSFSYNLGLEGNNEQTNRVRLGKYGECAQKFLEYVYVDGRFVQGLLNRRKEEKELFEEGMKFLEKEKKSKILTWNDFMQYYNVFKPATCYEALVADNCYSKQIDWHKVSEETRKAIMLFQRKHGLEIDGIIGHVTFAAMERVLEIKKQKPQKENVSVLTKGHFVALQNEWKKARLVPLELKIMDLTFCVVSGQPNAQKFRLASDPKSVPGCMEPIPQAIYRLGNLEVGDFGNGIGKNWVSIDPVKTMKRGAFGFHIDENISTFPGSAGCVVFSSYNDLNRFVEAKNKFNVTELVVDWGIHE
jgi:lysozyme